MILKVSPPPRNKKILQEKIAQKRFSEISRETP
jgi:hypothetical protein